MSNTKSTTRKVRMLRFDGPAVSRTVLYYDGEVDGEWVEKYDNLTEAVDAVKAWEADMMEEGWVRVGRGTCRKINYAMPDDELSTMVVCIDPQQVEAAPPGAKKPAKEPVKKPRRPRSAKLAEVKVAKTKDNRYRVAPVFAKVNRPVTRSWVCTTKAVAESLYNAIAANGEIITEATVATDKEGRTYAAFKSTLPLGEVVTAASLRKALAEWVKVSETQHVGI